MNAFNTAMSLSMTAAAVLGLGTFSWVAGRHRPEPYLDRRAKVVLTVLALLLSTVLVLMGTRS